MIPLHPYLLPADAQYPAQGIIRWSQAYIVDELNTVRNGNTST